jgi:hypothetical protein
MEKVALRETNRGFCRKGGVRFETGVAVDGTFDSGMIRGENL